MQVKVSKTDVSGKKELEGAKLEVRNEFNQVVDSWTSTKDSHFVNGLEEGQTYTLIEEQAAEGYICSDPISFTIENIDSLKQIHLINHQIFVYKSDQFKNPVHDVHLQVLNSDGEVIDEWITGKKI